ncbi:hypothetical protein Tco_0807338 [Tanacetum coccineum]
MMNPPVNQPSTENLLKLCANVDSNVNIGSDHLRQQNGTSIETSGTKGNGFHHPLLSRPLQSGDLGSTRLSRGTSYRNLESLSGWNVVVAPSNMFDALVWSLCIAAAWPPALADHLQNLYSLLGHEGLSDKVYTLTRELLKKLASIVPSHRKFFIVELSDLARSLSSKAVPELITLRNTQMLVNKFEANTEYIQRGQPHAGFPLFESESLKWPGTVEFDDVNGKVLTYSTQDSLSLCSWTSDSDEILGTVLEPTTDKTSYLRKRYLGVSLFLEHYAQSWVYFLNCTCYLDHVNIGAGYFGDSIIYKKDMLHYNNDGRFSNLFTSYAGVWHNWFDFGTGFWLCKRTFKLDIDDAKSRKLLSWI